MGELDGKVAIVTGGSSGIGYAIAQRFIEEGAAVAIFGRNEETGAQAQQQLNEIASRHGAPPCVFLHADVADNAQVHAAVATVVQRWGHIHVVVNNAAIMKTGRLIDMSPEDWDKIMAINLRGPFLLAKHALLHMPPGGSIINISSVHAIATDAHSAAYSSSKGGLEALTRALALECYAQQIRVNALRLGAVDTDMLWHNPEVQSGEEKIEQKEVGKPRQIADVALFLATERASFVSGAVLSVDGGRLPILGSHAH